MYMLQASIDDQITNIFEIPNQISHLKIDVKYIIV